MEVVLDKHVMNLLLRFRFDSHNEQRDFAPGIAVRSKNQLSKAVRERSPSPSLAVISSQAVPEQQQQQQRQRQRCLAGASDAGTLLAASSRALSNQLERSSHPARDYDSQAARGKSTYDLYLGDDGMVHPLEVPDLFERTVYDISKVGRQS